MDKKLLEIYSDYLNCTFAKPSAVGLANALDNIISHDKITRFLKNAELTNKELWQLIKPTLRKYENEKGVIVFDDTILHKPYSEENDLIAWHFDHTQNKTVKGINMLNCIYHYDDKTIPLAFILIKKTNHYVDKEGKEKRKSEKTKNEYVLEQLAIIKANKIKYHTIIFDSWFSCNNTLKYIHLNLKKQFVCAIKTNRVIALSEQDKKQGIYHEINSIHWETHTHLTVWLKGLNFPVRLHRQVFINKDSSMGYLYLISNSLNDSIDTIHSLYQKRWKVELFHKSLKSNANIEKSFAHTIKTQSNHIFSSVYAVFKLECISIHSHLNHFAIRAKLHSLFIKAVMKSYSQLFSQFAPLSA